MGFDMWCYLFGTIAIGIIISLGTVLYYSLNRINQYEHLIENVFNIIDFMDGRLKTIDSSGHFEADDEVGFFFEELKRLHTILYNVFENNKEIEDGDEKKKEK